MATAKKRKKKNKIKIFPIILVLIIVGGLFTWYHFDAIVKKAKDFNPSNFTYPTKYEEYVIKYSNKFDIDARFVYAIINTESHFDPNATSNVGARGLMQLMDEAYNWVKFRLDDTRKHTFDDMYDPELNIEYGTYMLKYLYDRYDGSYELTAAAYHGGMGAVDGWIETGTVDPKNFKLEDVPSDVTANYIYKVTNAYNKYKHKLKDYDKTTNERNVKNGQKK